jgi:hypothetical protein
MSECIPGKDEPRCACHGEGESKFESCQTNTGEVLLLSSPLSSTTPLAIDMLTRLPRIVAFTTRRSMATYRKTREPYDLKKKLRAEPNSPSLVQKNSRKYAPVYSRTSFGLRPPEKQAWKPNDGRFDTSTAREFDRPVGGAPRQHLVVRPTKKDGGAAVAGPETTATPGSQSQGECKSF